MEKTMTEDQYFELLPMYARKVMIWKHLFSNDGKMINGVDRRVLQKEFNDK